MPWRIPDRSPRRRLPGRHEMVPMQIYNGYGEFVASLYTDRINEKLLM